jgi:serine/threonine protein kinase
MPYEALTDNIYSFKSDIWAIGVIFYEMLTGRTPWRAKTEADLKKILKLNSIKSLLPLKISKISEEFLMKTLAFDP